MKFIKLHHEPRPPSPPPPCPLIGSGCWIVVASASLTFLSPSCTAHSGQVTCVAASPHQDSVFLSCGEVRYSLFFPSHFPAARQPSRPKSSVEASWPRLLLWILKPLFSSSASRTVEFYSGILAVPSQRHRWVSRRARWESGTGTTQERISLARVKGKVISCQLL